MLSKLINIMLTNNLVKKKIFFLSIFVISVKTVFYYNVLRIKAISRLRIAYKMMYLQMSENWNYVIK